MQKTRWKWQWLIIFVVNPFSSLFIRTGLVTKECAKLYNHHRHLPSCKYFFSLVCMRALVKHTQSLHTAANALHTFTKTTETLLIFYLIKFQFGCKYVLLAYYYRATTIILPLNVKRMVVLIFFSRHRRHRCRCCRFGADDMHVVIFIDFLSIFLRDAIFIHKLDFTHRHQSTLNWLHATF